MTDLDAREMLRSLQTFPLLDGYRGAPRCDIAAIEDVLLRVSAMVEAHPEIAELDLQPARRSADGAMIVDARVRVEAAPPWRRCRRCAHSADARSIAAKYGAVAAIAPITGARGRRSFDPHGQR